MCHWKAKYSIYSKQKITFRLHRMRYRKLPVSLPYRLHRKHYRKLPASLPCHRNHKHYHKLRVFLPQHSEYAVHCDRIQIHLNAS
jgi:hypothetical protein